MDIHKFIFNDGKVAALNLNLYKNSPLLKGADIFKTLLGINQNSEFKKVPLNKNNNLHNTFFEDFYIDLESWNLLETFIKTGQVPFHRAYKISNYEKFYNIVIQNIEKLNVVCNILGGFPEFDKYYEEFYNEIESSELPIYNPFTPEEDVKKKYLWGILLNKYGGDQRSYELNHNPRNGWSVVKIDQQVPNHLIYYRKLKINDAEDAVN
tara:strand:+ start:350 stop:976 length:627 start_codon:yes stop_codon:yes gene_type:complete